MDRTYQIGQNRYKPNGYFIYRIENALINKAKDWTYQIPMAGTIILFCPRVGGSELAKLMSYDKETEQAALQFLDDKTSFRFNVNSSEVFVEWEDATGNDKIVIDYYSTKELIFINAALESAKETLKQLKIVKESYLRKIEDPNTLIELVSSVKLIQSMANDLMTVIEKPENKNVIEKNAQVDLSKEELN